MVQGLENKMYKEWLRELELFNLERKKINKLKKKKREWRKIYKVGHDNRVCDHLRSAPN